MKLVRAKSKGTFTVEMPRTAARELHAWLDAFTVPLPAAAARLRHILRPTAKDLWWKEYRKRPGYAEKHLAYVRRWRAARRQKSKIENQESRIP